MNKYKYAGSWAFVYANSSYLAPEARLLRMYCFSVDHQDYVVTSEIIKIEKYYEKDNEYVVHTKSGSQYLIDFNQINSIYRKLGINLNPKWLLEEAVSDWYSFAQVALPMGTWPNHYEEEK